MGWEEGVALMPDIVARVGGEKQTIGNCSYSLSYTQRAIITYMDYLKE